MAKLGPLSGQTLGGKYKLEELLGEGGFGAVYKAYNLSLKRPQAIKVLLERHLHDDWFHNRFISEAEAQAQLDHSNIMPVQDFGTEGDLPYMVMPYIKGGTLQDILDGRSGMLALDEIVRYLEQICPALDYIHRKNLVHLDLKPSNLLVHEDGRLLLSDFGLVRPVEHSKAQGGPSLGAGTPLYMAPEHQQGHPDKRSDVYSVGMILYEMILHQVALRGTVPLQIARPDLPPPAVPVLKKALAPLPEDRHQSAGALLSAFKAALPSGSSQQIPQQPRARSQPLPPTIPAQKPPVGFDHQMTFDLHPPLAHKPPKAKKRSSVVSRVLQLVGGIVVLSSLIVWFTGAESFVSFSGGRNGFLVPTFGVLCSPFLIISALRPWKSLSTGIAVGTVLLGMFVLILTLVSFSQPDVIARSVTAGVDALSIKTSCWIGIVGSIVGGIGALLP